MTEVKQTSHGSLGLFATKNYVKGDIILKEEKPLLSLSSTNETDIKNQFQHEIYEKLLDESIENPKKYYINPPPGLSEKNLGKFKGMLRTAAAFSVLSDVGDVKSKLLQLYHPNSTNTSHDDDEEKELMKISEISMSQLSIHVKPGSNLAKHLETDKESIMKIMLIWACNAFEGGCLYEKSCRINHSCDPNTYLLVPTSSSDENMHTLKAMGDIKAGEELFISYLGVFVWTDRNMRQNILKTNKHFVCKCSRCTKSDDIAASIPCPYCHTREGLGKKYLPEDVQWDDQHEDILKVHYSYPKIGIDKNNNEFPLVYSCNTCNGKIPSNDPLLKTNEKVIQKVTNYILQKPDSKIKTDPGESTSIQTEMEEQLYQLSSSILGANHWTTNMMLLSLLDRSLSDFNTTMLLGNTLPKVDELAESIDSLQRIWKFAENLCSNNDVHYMSPEFLVHRQTIGIARALISLGDVKSMQYGSEWVSKVEEYVDLFEEQHMGQVVQTLKDAWKTPKKAEGSENDGMEEDESNNSPNKRARK